MKRILLPLFIFVFAACSSNTSSPTLTAIPPTPSATVTATLTPASTVTFTPTPAAPELSVTPAVELPPEVVTQVETQLPGYTLVGDQLKDSAGNILPEIHVWTFDNFKSFACKTKQESTLTKL